MQCNEVVINCSAPFIFGLSNILAIVSAPSDVHTPHFL